MNRTPNRTKKIVRWIFFSLIFLALPMIILPYGISQHWTSKQTREKSKAISYLEQQVLTLLSRTDSERYLEHLMTQVFRQASIDHNLALLTEEFMEPIFVSYNWFFEPFFLLFSEESRFNILEPLRWWGKHCPDSPIWRKRLNLYINSLKRRFPGVFTFYITDRTGRIVPKLSDSVSDPMILAPLHHAFLITEASFFSKDRAFQARFIAKIWKKVQPFLGSVINPIAVARKGNFNEANITREKRFFFARAAPLFGFFAHVSMTKGWADLAAKDLTFRFKKAYGKIGIKLGVFRPGANVKWSDPLLGKILETMIVERKTRYFDVLRIVAMYPIQGGAYFWAMQDSDSWDYTKERSFLVIFFTLVFALLAIFSFRVMVEEQVWEISLRWQLILLFLFASGLPLLVITIAGRDYLERRLIEHRQDAYNDLERILRFADQSILSYLRQIEKEFQRVVAGVKLRTPKEKRRLLSRLRKICRIYPKGSVSIVSAKGKTLWSNSHSDSTERNKRKLLGNICSAILSTLNYETGSFIGLLMVNVFNSFRSGGDVISDFTRNLGTFQELSVGKKPSWIIVLPIISSDGKANSAVCGYWARGDMEKAYVQRILPRIERREGDLFLQATGRDYRISTADPSIQPESKIRFMWEELHVTGGTMRRELKLRGKTYLFVGIHPREIVSKYFLAARSDELVQEKYRTGRKFLLLFAGFCSAVSLYLGNFLAQRFLIPIGELVDGVASIEARHFRISLPALEQDELGDLKRAFNHMTEGLAELEVARIVQESLFPQKALEIKPYRIFGKSLPAAQLGGDYFDLRQLPDGRVLFLIADVSGHGVPAALVMAMAKALVVDREMQKEEITPEKVLEAIQDVVFASIQVKKMMTCQAGILDPKTGLLTIANAGHNFPVLYRAEGCRDEIEFGVSMPMAKRRKKGFSRQQFTLSPGETFLMYTDGIVEAIGFNGKALGYELVFNSIGNLLEPDPVETFERIIKWQDEKTQKGPQEDDITLLLITCEKEKV